MKTCDTCVYDLKYNNKIYFPCNECEVTKQEKKEFFDTLEEKLKITKGQFNAKKGYWELSGLSPYIGIRTCSVCKAEYDINKRFNECPNCGTKMLRESEKENKE